MFQTSINDQARCNYEKNRGNPGAWFEHKANYQSPRPQPRARPEGMRIAEKNRPTISTLMQDPPRGTPEPPEKVPVRLRPGDGMAIAEKFHYQKDKWFDFEGNQNYRPEKRGLKCYPKSVQTVVEKNHQQRSNDWYYHDRPPPPEPYHPSKGAYRAGKEIAAHMRSSRADEWFVHKNYNPAADNQTNDQRPSRARSEAMEYAIRNHGSASDWGTHHTVQEDIQEGTVDTEGHPYRSGSAQAVTNWTAARGKSMAQCFDYTTGYVSDRQVPRVRGEAAEFMERSRNGVLGMMVQGKGVRAQSAGPPCNRTRPEAQQYLERGRGHLGDFLDQSKNKDYSSPRPCPKAQRTAEAQAAAERNKGQMISLLGKTGYPPPAPERKVHARGVPSGQAEKNCSAAHGSSMKMLVENDRLPPDAPPKPRITAWGEDIAQRNHGTISQTLTNYGQNISYEPPPQRMRPEAAENAEKFKGRDFFSVIQQKPPSVRV